MSDAGVLVVGAGPTGLFAAAELLRRGHRCTILDRSAQPSQYSKALAIMPKTLGLFERAGVLEPFLAEINRVRAVRFVTPQRDALVCFDRVPTAYPYVAILPQWKTESLLRSRVEAFGGRVRFGHEAIALEQDANGVSVRIRHGGEEYVERARYVIGADGGNSTVRAQTNIAFEGRSYAQRTLLADVPVTTGIPPDEARVYLDRRGALTIFPISARLRRIVVIAPHEALPDCASLDWLRARLQRHGVREVEAEEPLWSSAFYVHGRTAGRLRDGRVFLAGDAAHVQSPVGGQGMNAGLFDAWALAETLAPVLAGEGSEDGLNRYERERLPAAQNW